MKRSFLGKSSLGKSKVAIMVNKWRIGRMEGRMDGWKDGRKGRKGGGITKSR